MALIGLATAFLGATVADLRGTDQTRWFSRRGFGVVGIHELGLDTAALDAVGTLGSVLL